MATLRTPPFKVSGLWELRKPWVCNGTQVYTCIAIRKFDEILLDQGDIYRDYYYPKGLAYGVYEADKELGASIVTILSEFGEEIDVPDTYIVKYPQVNLADYHHVVLSASLGPLPTKSNLTHVRAKMMEVLEAVVGKKPTIKLHSAPVTNAITTKQAQQAEQVRQSAITDRTTTYMAVSELEKKLTDTLSSNILLKKYVAQLEAEKEALLTEGTAGKVVENNKKLKAEVAKLTEETVNLKKKHAEDIKTLTTKLTKEKEDEVYKLNQEIFKLREALVKAKDQASVGIAPKSVDEIEEIKRKVLEDSEQARRKSSAGLKEDVEKKLKEQSQQSSPPASPPQTDPPPASPPAGSPGG